MKIAIDYYLKQEGLPTRIMHTTVTEDDIMQMLQKKFADEEIPYLIEFDRQKVKVEFVIDTVTV